MGRESDMRSNNIFKASMEKRNCGYVIGWWGEEKGGSKEATEDCYEITSHAVLENQSISHAYVESSDCSMQATLTLFSVCFGKGYLVLKKKMKPVQRRPIKWLLQQSTFHAMRT